MQQWLLFISENPMLRLLQLVLVVLGVLSVFLVCFTTRDILLRTRSLLFQLLCIILSVIPIVGFLLYLLIRPARTIKERELMAKVDFLLAMCEDDCDCEECACDCEADKVAPVSAPEKKSDAPAANPVSL